ncbi:cupin domain-containing protein [Streptomyces sp. H27-D2]|uniref:cupin domain-containing protein n=1 Tax=Streptomyces sp. H27-D2 TaxID=3046304 RepID=UPI002DBEEA70|nr:cupin domain-containing protein [Streptomyces sp. H27-D2]MEC4017869.1 cupin domain-containing protein [Streptomyces sp. H27-D2]
MDTRFDQVYTHPENEIFRVVFYPDRIYHARYLNATRSSRYRYYVAEVRGSADGTAIKGDVFLGGVKLCSMLRIEYAGIRLIEQAREFGRRLGPRAKAWVKITGEDPDQSGEATVTLHWDPVIAAYAVEIWETLEPPEGTPHDHRVLPLMGRDAPITRVPELSGLLGSVTEVAMAFREHGVLYPTGQQLENPQWDNAYLRSHQEPRDPRPSSSQNTVEDKNYLLDFQRGFFIPDASAITPVSYVNAMSDEDNPDRRPDNIVEMRWLFQRELGSDLVFFHEVTVPPGAVEGTHRHIGSEELYYIVSGTGTAYMSDGDDPTTAGYPLVERPVFGIGPVKCRELPVRPGSVIYTKSGGVHGIRNPYDEPLKFVAFLYHTT